MTPTDARANMFAALAPVLPGRVSAYPRAGDVRVAPSITIGQVDIVERPAGRVTVAAASFPVVVTVDGADDAQIALLDDVVWQCWAALSIVQAVHPRSTVPGVEEVGDRIWRTCEITVEATLGVPTWCAPQPVEATVPPTLITQGA